jgi:hypothetical protein
MNSLLAALPVVRIHKSPLVQEQGMQKKQRGIKKVQKRENKMIAEALPITMAGVLVVGQVLNLKAMGKQGKGGKESVACPKCNSAFRDQAEVDRHSAGYHV